MIVLTIFSTFHHHSSQIKQCYTILWYHDTNCPNNPLFKKDNLYELLRGCINCRPISTVMTLE